MYLLTVTVPGRATRPRSFRPRSTSITCSARSFGSRWSCSDRSWSSAGVAPRGRVPAIGWVVSLSRSTWTSSSGLAPTTSNDGTRTKNRYGLGLTRRRLRYSPMPSSALPVAGSVGQVERLAACQHDLDRLAGGDRVLGGLDGADVLVAPEARVGEGRRPPASARRSRRSLARRSPRPRAPTPTGARFARAPRRSRPRRCGSGPRGPGPRCAATRSPTACGRGGRTRGRGRSR